MSRTPNLENAEAIAALTGKAADGLASVIQALMDAVRLGEQDYPGNITKVDQAVGALHLLRSTVLGEHHVWTDYARARRSSSAVSRD